MSNMRDILYNIWLISRRWWQRRRSLHLYWICAKIINTQSNECQYKYYPYWAKNKTAALVDLKLKLQRQYPSPHIQIECRIGYTRYDLS